MSCPKELQTKMEGVTLVSPNVERDAPISVGWINGEHGPETMRKMGVAEKDIHKTTLAKEKERTADFILQPENPGLSSPGMNGSFILKQALVPA